MYLHFSQASTSRLASSARRSLALQCSPAACHAVPSAVSFLGLASALVAREAMFFSKRRASFAWASPGVGRAGSWYFVFARTALMTRCTNKSG